MKNERDTGALRGRSAMSAEGRFRRMVEGLKRDYFFYYRGTDGAFVYVSPSIRNILGYGAKEFLTHFTKHLTDAPVNVKARRHTADSLRGVRQPPYEVEMYHKDGSTRTLEILEIPVKEKGRVTAVEGIAGDITERKRLEETRDLLMHAIVHDLNNPLAVIIAGVELSADCPAGRSDCGNREHLRLVGELAMDMRKMLSDILDISRMEHGLLKFDRKPHQPVALVDSAAEAMVFVARPQAKTVTLAIPAGLPEVKADPGIIKRVLENLIANALRYAPKGSDVSVSAADQPEERVVRFSVTDKGPGIKPGHLEKVFEKYFQSDPCAEKARKGKGLGLTFCSMAVSAHGGRIWAENVSPKGCRLSFTLPAVPRKARRRKV